MLNDEVTDTLSLVHYVGKQVFETRHIVVWRDSHVRKLNLICVKSRDFLVNENDRISRAHFLKLWLQFTCIPVLVRDHNHAETNKDADEEWDTSNVRPNVHSLVVAGEQALT